MTDWNSTRAFYASPYWERLSRQVRRRDNWTCRDCGFRAVGSWARQRLHAHHVVSRPHVAHTTPLDVASNLVTLCASCHEVRHGFRSRSGPSSTTERAPVALRAPRPALPQRPTTPRPFRPTSHRSGGRP